jgi:xanthine dehydrogenase molybdenum-binding subunit
MDGRDFKVLGRASRRKNAVARVTGREIYSVDVALPRMLHGRVLISPYAHARIRHIDASEARAMGAVVIAFPHTDGKRDDSFHDTKGKRSGSFHHIPKARYSERIITTPPVLHKDFYVLADKVRYRGEAVAAVAAETEELAEKAVRAIHVEYEPLPVHTDPLGAMAEGAEPIYDTVLWGGKAFKIENNVASEREIEEGDVDRAFAEADVVVAGSFRTPKVYHAQMEPKTAICRPEPDGGLTLWCTTQSIHNVRIVLGEIFGIPLSKINVKRVPIGGTFGSSIQMNPPIPIAAALALKAGRPVKVTMTREEDAHDHTRYGTQIDLELAAAKDGTLLGAKMNLIADIGAHNVQAYSFLGVCVGWLVSLYRIPAIRYRGTAVYTNKAPSCGLGDTFWGQGPLVRSIVQSDGVPELLRRGAEAIGWEERQRAPAIPSRCRGTEGEARYRRGIGMARGFHTSSAGAPQPGDVIDFSGAMVKVNTDGSVDVITALMDLGGGTHEAVAKLVAEALCVPLDKVDLAPAETRSTVYDVCTHATRGVYAGGGAAVKAAQTVRKEIIETAATFMNVMPDALTLRLDEERGQAIIHAPAMPDRAMTLAELATRCWSESRKTLAAVESYRATNCPPAYVTVFVDVEVDTWTGQVETKRAVMGSDCGTVINPKLAAGQLEGGLSMGAVYALYEDAQWDADGRLVSGGYWIDAKTPAIGETPRLQSLDVHFADTYEPTGPFGAKGVGEAATNPVAAAYANAIYNAVGLRFYELPITPERLLKALRGGTDG